MKRKIFPLGFFEKKIQDGCRQNFYFIFKTAKRGTLYHKMHPCSRHTNVIWPQGIQCEFFYLGNDEPFTTSETGDRQLGYFVTRHPNRRGHLIFYIIPATCCVKWVKWQLNSQRCVERVCRHLLEQSDVNFKINVLHMLAWWKPIIRHFIRHIWKLT